MRISGELASRNFHLLVYYPQHREQHVKLQNVEWMKPDTFSSALKCIRSTGLRLSNAEKNVGVRKYAFTRLQLLSFPRLYRPPVGTYSLYAAT
ncbi:unnamed protein product [Dibothriocephalus latus]|uniref:Uncharacterized protein n=1 Tax=Dibothriocephalus latus TaxID=60516 RepID=A0A3P7KWY1_DIBLA|nr:unnamed protein product [Dibothriocephalus latus]